MGFSLFRRKPALLLIVCHANVTRSPFIAAMLRKQLRELPFLHMPKIEVASAGVAAIRGAPSSTTIRLVASAEGLNLNEHRSQPITRELATRAKIILTLEKKYKEQILKENPEVEGKVFTVREYGRRQVPPEDQLDIADPTFKDVEDFNEFRKTAREETARIVEYFVAHDFEALR